jgi:uncharacterized membrane protein
VIGFLSKAEEQRLVDAIGRAEQNTSGEIRVHLEANCKGNPYERAIEVFFMLEMNKTSARNGVLIYVAIKDHKLAILGDEGINKVVPEHFWEENLHDMQLHFSMSQYAEGLERAIEHAGEKLKQYFPYDRGTDQNELSDAISLG